MAHRPQASLQVWRKGCGLVLRAPSDSVSLPALHHASKQQVSLLVLQGFRVPGTFGTRCLYFRQGLNHVALAGLESTELPLTGFFMYVLYTISRVTVLHSSRERPQGQGQIWGTDRRQSRASHPVTLHGTQLYPGALGLHVSQIKPTNTGDIKTPGYSCLTAPQPEPIGCAQATTRTTSLTFGEAGWFSLAGRSHLWGKCLQL